MKKAFILLQLSCLVMLSFAQNAKLGPPLYDFSEVRKNYVGEILGQVNGNYLVFQNDARNNPNASMSMYNPDLALEMFDKNFKSVWAKDIETIFPDDYSEEETFFVTRFMFHNHVILYGKDKKGMSEVLYEIYAVPVSEKGPGTGIVITNELEKITLTPSGKHLVTYEPVWDKKMVSHTVHVFDQGIKMIHSKEIKFEPWPKTKGSLEQEGIVGIDDQLNVYIVSYYELDKKTNKNLTDVQREVVMLRVYNLIDGNTTEIELPHTESVWDLGYYYDAANNTSVLAGFYEDESEALRGTACYIIKDNKLINDMNIPFDEKFVKENSSTSKGTPSSSEMRKSFTCYTIREVKKAGDTYVIRAEQDPLLWFEATEKLPPEVFTEVQGMDVVLNNQPPPIIRHVLIAGIDPKSKTSWQYMELLEQRLNIYRESFMAYYTQYFSSRLMTEGDKILLFTNSCYNGLKFSDPPFTNLFVFDAKKGLLKSTAITPEKNFVILTGEYIKTARNEYIIPLDVTTNINRNMVQLHKVTLPID